MKDDVANLHTSPWEEQDDVHVLGLALRMQASQQPLESTCLVVNGGLHDSSSGDRQKQGWSKLQACVSLSRDHNMHV